MTPEGGGLFTDLPTIPPGAPIEFTYIVFGLSVLKFLGNAAPFMVKILKELKT